MKFNITSKEVNHSELAEWFTEKDIDYKLDIIAVNGWYSGDYYSIYEVEVDDEDIAFEFRLRFGANLGGSSVADGIRLQQEIENCLTAEITKEIDDAILNELLQLGNK